MFKTNLHVSALLFDGIGVEFKDESVSIRNNTTTGEMPLSSM
jgi:hypothetical protein